MNLHSVYTSCKWDNTSICPFVTLLLSCQQCFQEGALSFRYVLWLPKANCPYEPPPVLLSLHLNLLQSVGWSQRHHHCTHTLFSQVLGTQLGPSSLQAKPFFIAKLSPQPMSEHVSKSHHISASLLVPSFLYLNTTSLYIYATFYLSAHLLTGAYLYLCTIGNDAAVDTGLQKWFIQEHMLQ